MANMPACRGEHLGWDAQGGLDDIEKRPQTAFDVEKKQATGTYVRPVLNSNDSQDSQPGEQLQWNPGWLSRFPWLGMGALLVVMICAAAAVVALVTSDGVSQRHWPHRIRPSVILNGLNSVANIFFTIAIANGVAIAWWRKTLKGATIEQLHKSWQFSSSVVKAAFSGKSFNVIALAALTAKLTIIDGLLMQSATDTYLGPDSATSVNITGSGTEIIPATGFIDGSGGSLWMNDALRQNLAVWAENPKQLPLTTFSNCEGLCFFNVPAAGFEFDCSTTQKTFSIQSQPNSGPVASGNSTNTTRAADETLLYRVKFSSSAWDRNNGSYWDVDTGALVGPLNINMTSPANMTMEVVYTLSNKDPVLQNEQTYCAATQYNHTCVLRPSVVTYPVLMQNITVGQKDDDGNSHNNLTGIWVGITEDSYAQSGLAAPQFDQASRQQTGFQVQRRITVNESYISDDNGENKAQLGPLATAFDAYLGGQASLTAQQSASSYGWDMVTSGNAAMFQTNMAGYDTAGQRTGYECDYKFSDPLYPDPQADSHLQSIVMSINQIMFALSTNTALSNITFVDNDEFASVPADTPKGNAYNKSDHSTWRYYQGTQYSESIHYRTNYGFMAGALASTFVCILFILPVYWGYWQLGRAVSLGPFEIAHAFRSPMTARATNVGGIEEVIKEVGAQPVVYGKIVEGDAKGVIGVAEPEYVARMMNSGNAKGELRQKVSLVLGNH